jgi:hypothetical protein
MSRVTFPAAVAAAAWVVASASADPINRVPLKDLDGPQLTAAFKRFVANSPLKTVSDARTVADLTSIEARLDKSLPQPRLDVTFAAINDPPGQPDPAGPCVQEFLANLLNEADYRLIEPGLTVFLRPRNGAAPPPPPPPPPARRVAIDPFQLPAGYSPSIEALVGCVGSVPVGAFPFTPANCMRLATAAYRRGQFEDAVVLLNHAAQQDGQAAYYYLKAMAELQLGRGRDAIASVQALNAAQTAGRIDGLGVILERFNGPYRAHLSELAKLYY